MGTEEKDNPKNEPEQPIEPEEPGSPEETTANPLGRVNEPASPEPPGEPAGVADEFEHLSRFDQSIVGPANVVASDKDDIGIPEEPKETGTIRQAGQIGTGTPEEIDLQPPASTPTMSVWSTGGIYEKPGEDVAEEGRPPSGASSSGHDKPGEIADEPLIGSDEYYVPPVSEPAPKTDRYWETPQQRGVSQDERTASAIAHGSTLLNLVSGFGGILVALVIWLSYKDRSEYVRYQALQSMVFQLVALGVTIGAGILAAVLIFLGIALAVVAVGIPIIIFGALLALVGTLVPIGALVYGVVAAVQTYDGKDFRYWLVGDWISRK